MNPSGAPGFCSRLRATGSEGFARATSGRASLELASSERRSRRIELIDTCQEALALLLLREMEEKLDDVSAVGMKVFLKIYNRAIPIVPDRLVVRGVRDAFAEQNFGMHAGNQNLLAIGSVEDANPPAFRKVAGGAPEKIVLQFTGAGMFEAEP